MDETILLYQQLLGVNEKAFKLQLFGAAYHALSGAMYCASSLKDSRLLCEVEQTAREQLLELTAQAPHYSAGHTPLELSLYTSLVQIVHTRRVLFGDGF